MKVLKFSFLFHAIFLCLGIVLHSYVASAFSILILVILLCFLWITSRKTSQVRTVRMNTLLYGGSISLVFFCLGHLSMSFQAFKMSLTDLSYADEPSIVFVIEQKLSSSVVNNNRYIARVVNIDNKTINKPLLVNYFNKEGEELAVSHSYYSKTTPRVLNSPKNKGSFDYQRYMYVTYQITEQVYTSEVLELGQSNLWRDRLRRFRESLISGVNHEEQLTATAKSLVLALVFGDRSMLDAEIKNKFSTLGIMHILAISGLHIGIIYLLLLGVVSYFNRKVRFVLITVALWFFVFLSGFSPPVYRAVLMFSLISLSLVCNRDTNLANSVGIALVVSLLLEPLLIYNVSFQLSYLAVLSIVFFYPLVGRLKVKYKLVNYFIDILLISTVVQVGLIPLQLYYFEQFSFGYLIGNLIAIPVVTILLILAIVNVFLLVLLGRIPFVFSEVLNIISSGFTWVIDQLQWFSFLVFDGVKISQNQIGLYFISIICFYFIWRTRKKFWLFPLLCSFNLFVIFSNRNLSRDVYRESFVFPYVYKKDTVKFFHYQNDVLKRAYLLEGEQVVRILPYQEYTFLFLTEESPYYLPSIHYEYLIVSGKVQINYNRLFTQCQFKEVIIGNRTPFWIRKYIKESCTKNNIPFHDVYEKGYWEL